MKTLFALLFILAIAMPVFAQCGFDCGGTENAPRCEFADPWAPPHPEYKCVLVVSPECTNKQMFGPCLYCAYDMCQSASNGGGLDASVVVLVAAARLRHRSLESVIALERGIDVATSGLSADERARRTIEMYRSSADSQKEIKQ